MLCERDRKVLQKILLEIKKLERFVDGFNFDKFMKDEKTMHSVAMVFINIGELVQILSDEFKKSTVGIPFNAISKTRNVAAHRYEVIRFDYIWTALQSDIPDLKMKIENLLK